MVQQVFKCLGPYSTHDTLPAPSGLFAHPKSTTSDIPPAIPPSGPGSPWFLQKNRREGRRSARIRYDWIPSSSLLLLHRIRTSPPHVSRHTAQLRGRQREDRLLYRAQQYANAGRQHLPIIHNVRIRELSSPTPVHTVATRVLLDTNHTSSMKTSSARRHAAPIKSNTVEWPPAHA